MFCRVPITPKTLLRLPEELHSSVMNTGRKVPTTGKSEALTRSSRVTRSSPKKKEKKDRREHTAHDMCTGQSDNTHPLSRGRKEGRKE